MPLRLATFHLHLHACNSSISCYAELIQAPVQASVSDCDSVSCGVEFTMWLCQGKLFSAGLPQYGQLGHGTDHEYNAKECELALVTFLLHEFHECMWHKLLSGPKARKILEERMNRLLLVVAA